MQLSFSVDLLIVSKEGRIDMHVAVRLDFGERSSRHGCAFKEKIACLARTCQPSQLDLISKELPTSLVTQACVHQLSDSRVNVCSAMTLY